MSTYSDERYNMKVLHHLIYEMQDVVPHGHECKVQAKTKCLRLRNRHSIEKRNLCNVTIHILC